MPSIPLDVAAHDAGSDEDEDHPSEGPTGITTTNSSVVYVPIHHHPSLRGSCLCGSVRLEISRTLDSCICHCDRCRKFTGNHGAYALVHLDDLTIDGEESLKWWHDPMACKNGKGRGFCCTCGSSLLKLSESLDTIYVALGTLNGPTGLAVTQHLCVEQKGDFY